MIIITIILILIKKINTLSKDIFENQNTMKKSKIENGRNYYQSSSIKKV